MLEDNLLNAYKSVKEFDINLTMVFKFDTNFSRLE